jgi:hypothetical protein
MTGTDASFTRMKADISMERPTISAHRLWTTLWIFLGQPLDNSAWRVGNRRATNSCRWGTHTAAQPPEANATAALGLEPVLACGKPCSPSFHRPYDYY